MDFLSDDLIIHIATKVTSHSVRDLFNFMRMNTRHVDLCRSRDVSRAFGDDCTELLANLCMTHAKLNFIDRLLNARNPLFCILRSTQHMLHFKPRLGEIDRLLRNAFAADSMTARYFHLSMRVTSIHLFDLDEVLTDFWVLLKTYNLQRYRMVQKAFAPRHALSALLPTSSSMYRRWKEGWSSRPTSWRWCCVCPDPLLHLLSSRWRS